MKLSLALVVVDGMPVFHPKEVERAEGQFWFSHRIQREWTRGSQRFHFTSHVCIPKSASDPRGLRDMMDILDHETVAVGMRKSSRVTNHESICRCNICQVTKIITLRCQQHSIAQSHKASQTIQVWCTDACDSPVLLMCHAGILEASL